MAGSSTVTTRLTAGDRLARLLSIIPWVSESDGVPISEIERRFDYPRALLLGDLQNVVFFVGVHPFTPDQLVEVTISDDKVWIKYADWFARPLKLSSQEAATLLTTARAALSVVGDDAPETLVRALTKLGAMLGGDADQILDVGLGEAPIAILDGLRDAIDSGVCVDIDYYSYGRDVATKREVDPVRLFSDQGNWYLDAWCKLADEFRMFRVDRIRSTTKTSNPAHHNSVRTVPSFEPSDDDPRIELTLDRSAMWVVEQYPCESVTESEDGRTIVVLAITEVPWIQRLLLRLGPAATMTSREGSLPDDLVPEAARKVLALYGR